MTPEEKIDANVEAILNASGTSLRNYSMQRTREQLRDAMRKIMSDSFIEGSNAMAKIMGKYQ